MTTREQTTNRPREAYDWDAEQEVDFRRYWDALVARWWLLLVGIVLGAIGRASCRERVSYHV